MNTLIYRSLGLRKLNLILLLLLLAELCSCSGSNSNSSQQAHSPPSPPNGPPTFISDTELQARRWRRDVVAVFGVNRNPDFKLDPIPKRQLGRPQRTISRPENPKTYLDHLAACVRRYDREWDGDLSSGYGGTVAVLKNLRNVSSGNGARCWSAEQAAEIAELEQELHQDLDELRTRTSSTELERAKNLELSRLENFNNETQILLTRLGRHYQEVQENLSYCRLNDVTRNVPEIRPIPAEADPTVNSEDKALLHVVGDIFGEKSGMEGQTLSQSRALLERRRAVIQIMIDQLAHKKYITSIEQAEPCREILGGYHPDQEDHAPALTDFKRPALEDITAHIDSALILMTAFDQSVDAFRKEFLLQVTALAQPNDWFYFMGGSLKHAVLYKVIKQDAHSYKFRIYNSGDGAQFHSSSLDGSSNPIFPFIERNSVSHDQLTRFAFLKSLRDLSFQDTYAPNSKMAFVYDNILRELGGNLTTPMARAEDFLDAQIAGNCSYFILPFMETSRLGDQALGAHLEFFVKSKIMDAYFKINENRLQRVNHARLLAGKSLTFYAEEVAKNLSDDPGRKGRYLDWGMARESAERVKRYRQALDSADQENQRLRLAESPKIDLSILRNLPAGKHIESALRTLTPIHNLIQYHGHLPALDIEHWTPQYENLNAKLLGFFNTLKPVVDDHSEDKPREYQRILEGVSEIAKRIPLDQVILNKMNEAELTKFLEYLNDLSQLHFWALVQTRTKATSELLGLPPVAFLTHLKLLTLTNQAIRIYGKTSAGSDFASFPSLYNKLLKSVLLDRGSDQWTSLLALQDHGWTENFREMAAYWKTEVESSRAHDIAFSWERLPLFSAGNSTYLLERIIFKSTSDMSSTHWSAPFCEPGPKSNGLGRSKVGLSFCKKTKSTAQNRGSHQILEAPIQSFAGILFRSERYFISHSLCPDGFIFT